jgi:hypothetical protein
MKKTVMIENGKRVSDFLNKVSINGNIPEALLTIENGYISANSVDATETMFSMCTCFLGKQKKDIGKIEIGVPQLPTIIKHLSTEDPYRLILDEEANMISITKKGKGALRVVLIDTDGITTALSTDINEDSLELESRVHFELSGDKLEELQDYISLTTCHCLIFEIDHGRLFAMSPETGVVQFKLFMCRTKEADLRIASYAKTVSDTLTMLKGTPVSFYLLKDKEIIMEQEGNYWGVLPIEE